MYLWNDLFNDFASADFATAARAAFVLALCAVLAWVAITLALATINRNWAIRIAPPLVRAVLVAGATASLAVPAHAEDSGRSAIDGLTLPDRPDTGRSDSEQAPSSAAEAPSNAHLVKPGDTLWAIAQSHADPDATAADIASAVAAWHDHNRTTIGDNPDLIHPGQHLEEPHP